MEWGLRKVLPNITKEKQSAFARHIIPVIVELCGPALSEAEIADLLMRIIEFYDPEAEKKDDKGEGDASQESGG
jgi:hypothetical protein